MNQLGCISCGIYSSSAGLPNALIRLVPAELDVGASVPLDLSGGLVDAVVGEAGEDAGALGEEEGRDVLGDDDLVPRQEPKCARHETHLGEVLRRRPIRWNLVRKVTF